MTRVRDQRKGLNPQLYKGQVQHLQFSFLPFLQSRKYALKVDIRYSFRGNIIYSISFLGDQPLLPLLLLLFSCSRMASQLRRALPFLFETLGPWPGRSIYEWKQVQ